MSDIFKNYYLVFDLDGSFLDKNSILVEKNIQAVDFFIQNGGLFSFATGRTNLSILQFLNKAKINAPAICYNGAAIYDFEKHEFLKFYPIHMKVRKIVEQISDQFPQIGLCVFTKKGFYVLQQDKYITKLEEEDQRSYCTQDEAFELDWLKVCMTGENSLLLSVENFLKTIDISGIDHVFSSPTFFELIAEGVSKGSRITDLRRLYPDKIICAAGDFFNDLEMLKAADIAGVIEGSPKELIDVADFVLCSNELGAANCFIDILKNYKKDR